MSTDSELKAAKNRTGSIASARYNKAARRGATNSPAAPHHKHLWLERLAHG